MNKTVYEQGFEKGFEEGLVKGLRMVLEKFLVKSFGVLTEKTKARWDDLNAEELEDLLTRIPDVASLKDLGLED